MEWDGAPERTKQKHPEATNYNNKAHAGKASTEVASTQQHVSVHTSLFSTKTKQTALAQNRTTLSFLTYYFLPGPRVPIIHPNCKKFGLVP